MSHRLRFLDVVRILSMALVMFGHFVLVGSFAPKIPGIINADKVSLPLLNANDWNLWRFERGFLTSLDTQSAILGVVLFFIVTGYLMPMMAERYSRIGFLINRLFRIIPALIAGTVAVAVFVYFSQGISFTPMNFVGQLDADLSVDSDHARHRRSVDAGGRNDVLHLRFRDRPLQYSQVVFVSSHFACNYLY